MKYCKNCEISYTTPLDECLLCHNHLEDDGKENEVYDFPVYKKERSPFDMIKRISSLVNIISIIIVLFIDYSVGKNLSWSLIVVVSNIYIALLLNLVLSKTRTSIKMFMSMILTIITVVIIGFTIDDYHWALDIFLPLALIANSLMLKIIIFSRPKKWRDYISYLLTSVIFNLLILLLNIFKVTNITWAVTTSFMYGIITIIAFLIFTPKDLKNEILRRFHI